MIHPVTVDLIANRGVPFADVTAFEGQDYTGATFRVEIRAYRDSPALLIGLDTQTNVAAQGVSLLAVTTDNGVPTSAVQIRIHETTLEALAFTNPRGGPLCLAYALDITGGGLGKHRRMQGAFILEPSANG